MPRAVLVLEERARDAASSLPLAPGRVLVAAVSGPRGRAVAGALAGAHVVADGADLPERLGALVDLRALDAPADVAGALAHAKASLFLAQAARPLLLASATAGGAAYVVVTELAQGSPVSAALHGLLKTAALEWPEVACCALDVDAGAAEGARESALADAVRDELRCGFLDVEVVRSARGRFVPVVVERPVAAQATDAAFVDARSVLVCSGGARGVTATTLRALAKAARPALLLLGRTPLVDEPACCAGANDEAALKRALVEDAKASGRSIQIAAIGEAAKAVLAVREIRAFLAELEQAGARVMYRAVDVRSVDEVARACADARAAFGPITGVVHGAGVLADKRIEDKTQAQVDRVMDTKVLGLHALLEATRADPVRVVALFSSVAGRFGNVGQVDYAMANEALNEMAVRLAARTLDARLLVKSFNWGPWEGGMVTPALKRLFAERGVRVLSHDDGARHFVDELAADDGCVEVVFGGELAPTPHAARPAHATPAPPAGPVTTSVRLAASTHPAYGDHAIGGIVVLPAVGALELMARASGATSFTDVRVLRGVKLPRFFDDGDVVDVRVEPAEGDGAAAQRRVTLAVPGAKAPSYSALARDARHAGAAPALELPRGDDASAQFGVARIYDALLFHGERFQLVDAIERMSREGCVARVRGSLGLRADDARAWAGARELAVDVGALDAALQLALLWARHETGGAFLPTAIARVDAMPPRAGALRAVLRGRSCDAARAVVDVRIEDAAGHLVCALTGVEVHRLADDDAFRREPSAEAGTSGASATITPRAVERAP